jgi:hypothetical protein
MNSWNYQYLGRRVRGDYEYRYTLRTVNVDNVNPSSPFDYQIHPMSLSIIKRPLTEESSTHETSAMKFASEAVQEQKIKQQQQTYEDYADNRRLYGKLGIRTRDGLGLSYFDLLEAENQTSQRQLIKEIDAAAALLYQQRQKNAAAQQQEQIKEIPGVVPLRELLGSEDKLLHLALQEDPANSYKEYGEDGHSSIVHTAYLPYPCGNPRCGICNNAAQIKKESQ